MTVLRNGKALISQLLPADLASETAFTIPDTKADPHTTNLAGTVAVTNGSPTVTGTGTAFTTDFAVNDWIFVVGDTRGYRISAITNNTSLTLAENYAGTTDSGNNYRKCPFTNTFAGGIFTDGRCKAITVGGSTANEADTDTGLGSEFTSGGLTRRSGVNIKTYLTDAVSGEGAWKANWETTFTATASNDVNEVGVANHATSGKGLHLMRQKLSATLKIKSGDLFNVILTLKLTGSNVTATPPANQAVVTYEGLREICRLLMDPSTTRKGEDDGAGDWQTDYTIGGVANRVERQFDARAIGSAGIARTLNRTDTALGTEHTTADVARRKDGDGDGDVRGSLMQEPQGGTAPAWDGSDPGNSSTTFGADTFTVFAGDTIQLAAKWILTASRTINESATVNGNNPSGGGPAPDDPGVMLMEFTEVDNIVMDDKGRFVSIHRLQVV